MREKSPTQENSEHHDGDFLFAGNVLKTLKNHFVYF